MGACPTCHPQHSSAVFLSQLERQISVIVGASGGWGGGGGYRTGTCSSPGPSTVLGTQVAPWTRTQTADSPQEHPGLLGVCAGHASRGCLQEPGRSSSPSRLPRWARFWTCFPCRQQPTAARLSHDSHEPVSWNHPHKSIHPLCPEICLVASGPLSAKPLQWAPQPGRGRNPGQESGSQREGAFPARRTPTPPFPWPLFSPKLAHCVPYWPWPAETRAENQDTPVSPLTGKQPSRGLQDGEMLLRGSGPKRSPRKSPRSRGGLRPQALRDPRESCPDAKQNWTASGKLETLRSLRP